MTRPTPQLPPDLFEPDTDPAERRRLAAADEALHAALRPTLIPDAFNNALRNRLLAQPVPAEPSPRSRPLPRLLALAASLLIGLFLGAQFLGNRPSLFSPTVAWADVVHAMNTVDHFHILAYTENPSASNPEERFSRIDMYHQAPDLWRSQGLNAVAFNTHDGTRIFFPQKGPVPTTRDSRLNLIPENFVLATKTDGLLAGVLTMIFHGNPPPGQPVKSDAVSASQGIEVFDYARTPTSQWARIWVLKDSRLPVRIHVYQPQFNGFMSVELDYSDPQPADFFNPVSFQKELTDKHITDPRAAYGIGMHPVAGDSLKPRNAAEIYESLGGNHAPTLRRVLTRPDGDIALITSAPMNRRPNGSDVFGEGYDTVSDSWGNTYLQVGRTGGWTPDEDARWYFTPTAPFKTGPAPRRLTFSYILKDYENGQPGPTERILATDTLDLPETSAAPHKGDWDDAYLHNAKPAALRAFIRATAPLSEQLAVVDAALARDPADAAALLWKVDLLRTHEREDAAWALFAPYLQQHFPDTLPALLANELHTYIGQYMIHLAHAARWAEFDALLAKIQSLRDALLRSSTHHSSSGIDYLFGSEFHSLLSQVLAFHDWQTLLRDHPPAVVNTFATADGALCVQLRVPLQPATWAEDGHSGGDHWNMSSGWFWDPRPTGNDWQVIGHLADMKTGDVWLALRPIAGQHPTSLTLSANAKLLRDNYYTGHADNTVTFPWSAAIPLPTPTVPAIKPWWTEHTANRDAMWFGDGPAPTILHTLVSDGANAAAAARAAGHFDDAIALYRKILAAPDDAYPAYLRDPINGPDSLADARRDYHVELIKTLIAADRLDDARTEIAALRDTLSPTPDLTSEADTSARSLFRAAPLALVRALIAKHQLTEARTELDTLAKDRPNVAALPDRDLNIHRGGFSNSINIRKMHQDAWQAFDTTWWQLQDAAAQSPH